MARFTARPGGGMLLKTGGGKFLKNSTATGGMIQKNDSLDSGGYQDEERESPAWWRAKQAEKGHPYSCFLDEVWTGSYQPGVRALLDHYGKGDTPESRVRSAFATNTYFFRTPSAQELQLYPAELVDCWKYHKEFLRIVKPELVICVGNDERFSAYSKLKGSVTGEGAVTRQLGDRALGDSRKCVRAFGFEDEWTSIGGAVLAVGIPHLSYALSMPGLLTVLDATIKDWAARPK